MKTKIMLVLAIGVFVASEVIVLNIYKGLWNPRVLMSYYRPVILALPAAVSVGVYDGLRRKADVRSQALTDSLQMSLAIVVFVSYGTILTCLIGFK